MDPNKAPTEVPEDLLEFIEKKASLRFRLMLLPDSGAETDKFTQRIGESEKLREILSDPKVSDPEETFALVAVAGLLEDWAENLRQGLPSVPKPKRIPRDVMAANQMLAEQIKQLELHQDWEKLEGAVEMLANRLAKAEGPYLWQRWRWRARVRKGKTGRGPKPGTITAGACLEVFRHTGMSQDRITQYADQLAQEFLPVGDLMPGMRAGSRVHTLKQRALRHRLSLAHILHCQVHDLEKLRQ